MREFISFLKLVSATSMYFFLLTCFSTIPLHAQQDAVLEQVRTARQKGMVFRPYKLFTYQDALENVFPLRSDLPEGAVLKINPNALQTLTQQRPAALSLELPRNKNGEVFQMDLVRVDLHTADFKLNTSSGPIAYETGIHYRGVLRDEAKTSVALSFSKGEVMGIIGFSESSNWVLGQLDGANLRDAYTVYREDDLALDKSFNCGSIDVSEGIRKVEHNLGELREVTPVNKTVRVYFECEYDLVTEKGGAAGAASFIEGIFNIVSLMYQNEGITTVISEIYAWTTPDSYPTNSSSNTLVAFRSARPSYNGDLAHLVSRGQPTGGGIAYVPGLCSGYGYAYSYVNSTYAAFPTYSWTANVITHEMGHNLGSPHTHDCAWNGNNTPLDGCGPAAGYSGTGSCTPLAAPVAPFKGTMMSYCHLLGGIGIDMNQGFGQQPGDRIRATVSAASCLSGGVTCNTPTTAQLLANNVTTNTATLVTNVSGMVGYDWRYRVAGTSTWTDVASAPSGSINITSLTPNSNYEFQGSVQCTAGGTWTAWSASKTFTTLGATCTAPTTAQTSVSNLAATTATLNCSVTGVVSYDWRYKLVSSSTWIDVTNTTANNLNVSALAAASNYEFQAAVQCTAGGAWSAWSASKTFTTLAAVACTAPTTAQMSATNITATTATLNCSMTGAVSYDWRYRLVATSLWTNLSNTSTNSVNIGGLQVSSNYQFQVIVQCTAGGAWTAWSASNTFITPSVTCTAPTTAQISASNITTSTATLNSSVTGVVGYDWRYRIVGGSTWTELNNTTASNINLSSLTAGSNYEFQVAVQCTEGGTWTAWSASNTFSTLSATCNAPTTAQISASNITASTATLNNSVTGVVGHDWRYRLVGSSTWIDLASTTMGSANLSGLIAASNYEFQVAVQCTAGGAWSAWSGSKTFTTLAIVCSTPNTAQMNATNIASNTATLTYSVAGLVSYAWRYRPVATSIWTNTSNTSTGSINISGLGAATNYQFQVSVQCTAGGTWTAWSATKTFTTLAVPCNGPTTAQIAANNVGATTVLLSCSLTGVANYDWRYRIVGSSTWTDLAASSSSSFNVTGLTVNSNYEFQVSVQCTAGGAWSTWTASKTFTTLASSCAAPNAVQIAASNLTASTATLYCYMTGVASYDWRYRIVGSSTWIDLAAGGSSSVNLIALTPSVNYEFQVSVQCTAGGSWSLWSGSGNFATGAQECGVPSSNQVSVTNLTATSARLNCLLSGAQLYLWQYRLGTGSWVNLPNTTVGTTTLSVLAPGTQYQFRVRVSCSGVYTTWSPTTTFVTPAALVGEPETSGSVTEPNLAQLDNLWLYPNPTRGDLNVSYNLNTDSKQVSILVYDLSGRQIQQHNLGAQKAGTYQHKIQPDLTPGLFFVRINSEKSSLVERFTVLR